MRSLRDRTLLAVGPIDVDSARRTWTEHAAILQAVADGNEELAAQRATRHVLAAGGEALK